MWACPYRCRAAGFTAVESKRGHREVTPNQKAWKAQICSEDRGVEVNGWMLNSICELSKCYRMMKWKWCSISCSVTRTVNRLGCRAKGKEQSYFIFKKSCFFNFSQGVSMEEWNVHFQDCSCHQGEMLRIKKCEPCLSEKLVWRGSLCSDTRVGKTHGFSKLWQICQQSGAQNIQTAASPLDQVPRIKYIVFNEHRSDLDRIPLRAMHLYSISTSVDWFQNCLCVCGKHIFCTVCLIGFTLALYC